MFGFDSVLALVGGLVAVLALAAGIVFLRWLSAHRDHTDASRG